MRLEKWFISNLDDSQRKIIVQSIDEDIIVSGAAGSGKTNLAIHRALQAKDKGTYAIMIFTIALKRMVAYGMEAVGLDKDRIAYEWAWENRGFDLSGDVYWDLKNKDCLYLVNDMQIRKFKRARIKTSSSYGVDFLDWVDWNYYCAFGRRVSWFDEITAPSSIDVNDTENYDLISSCVLYKQIEPKIDYVIVDEAQDFNIEKYRQSICPKKSKSLSLFGDTAQQIYGMSGMGSSMEEIAGKLKYKQFSLKYNYRLPKTIAKMAQDIQNNTVDLLTNNMKDNGDSDYPNYPKPRLTQYNSKEDELAGIVRLIKNEDLDDVAILVQDERYVMEMNEYLKNNGINTQVHYRTGKTVPFRTINTLDFSNNDLPCILTYYAAKGSEFDNVFVPFMNTMNSCTRNQLYVACTRSSRNLYISYYGQKNHYLDNINPNYIDER